MASGAPPLVTVVGGGMITADQLLPSLFHLQRTGMVGGITVSALSSAPLNALAKEPELAAAFPGQRFTPLPALSEPPENLFPDLFRAAIRAMPPRQIVVVAVPDPLHHEVVMAALGRDQHVLCVKPLALTRAHAVEIEQTARERGLFVGVEYHKRFDRRALMARRAYAEGRVGRFVFGEATLIEPYAYRNSNFQTWFTPDRTDPFTYIGCHYVDLVSFITGLRPVEVSVRGVEGAFPNGARGYLWSSGRVLWENGALLTVTNGLGYPDGAAGSNNQGMLLYCEGEGKTGMIRHDDHDRGVSYSFLEGQGAASARFRYLSPDYFRLVPWEGVGLRPVGYGFDSVAAIVEAVSDVERAAAGLPEPGATEARKRRISEVESRGIICTPANSPSNELVVEAGRLSIRRDGAAVRILYGPSPQVEPAGGERG
jgi:D-galacturonate reductase